MFVSVDGKAKKVTEIFAGGSDGKAHKITELFGSVNGVAKQLYTSVKETNSFDAFTWAEIKQLANDGLLLEHFNLYDKVTIKLNKTLTSKCVYYDKDVNAQYLYPKQDTLILQITSLTENTMRLSSPYASIFSKMIATGTYANNGLDPWTTTTTSTAPYEDSSSVTVTTTDYSDSFYWQFSDALPEDLKAILDGQETLRNTQEFSSGGSVDNTETCYVRNLSEPVLFATETHSDDIPVWYEITESQFPRKKSAYLYHYALPDDFGSTTYFGTGKTFFYATGSSSYYRQYFCTKCPLVTWSHTDKYTSPGNGETWVLRSYQYANQQSLKEYFTGTQNWDFIPEISISADV